MRKRTCVPGASLNSGSPQGPSLPAVVRLRHPDWWALWSARAPEVLATVQTRCGLEDYAATGRIPKGDLEPGEVEDPGHAPPDGPFFEVGEIRQKSGKRSARLGGRGATSTRRPLTATATRWSGRRDRAGSSRSPREPRGRVVRDGRGPATVESCSRCRSSTVSRSGSRSLKRARPGALGGPMTRSALVQRLPWPSTPRPDAQHGVCWRTGAFVSVHGLRHGRCHRRVDPAQPSHRRAHYPSQDASHPKP